MSSAELLRQNSWALILIVMVIYASLSIVRRWLANRRDKDFGTENDASSPEGRTRRMRILSFFAAIGIISFTAVAIMNSF